MRAGLAARALPDVAPAWGSAQLAGRSAPHTIAHAHTESPTGSRAARGNLADSTTSIAPTAAGSDRFALLSGAARRPASFSGSRKQPIYRIARHHCARQSSQSNYYGWPV